MYPDEAGISLPPNPDVPTDFPGEAWYNSGEMRMQWPCELTPTVSNKMCSTPCLILACARRRRLREPEAAGNEDAAGRQGDDGLRAAESPLALCASLPSPSGYVTRMGDKLN